jgi:hypothetical protein
MSTATKTNKPSDLGVRILARHKKRVLDISEEQKFYRETVIRKAQREELPEQEDEALEICAGILGHDLKADLEKLAHVFKLEQKWLKKLAPGSRELRDALEKMYAEVEAKKAEAVELENKARQLRLEAGHIGNNANTIEAAGVEIIRLQKEELSHVFPKQGA